MIDTHCHIHGEHFSGDAERALRDAKQAGVDVVINVGTNVEESRRAVEFAKKHNSYATVAQHPHDAKDLTSEAKQALTTLAREPEVVAIGECGLDYYYNHSPKTVQHDALRWHLNLARDLGLPLSFHVRDAFEDFWPIFDDYQGLKGVVHSFTAGPDELNAAIERGLYVAFNGIMTFTKDAKQLEAVRIAPLDKIVVETDSPFLTPHPLRGKINEPKHIHLILKKIAEIKRVSVAELAKCTTDNAKELFNI